MFCPEEPEAGSPISASTATQTHKRSTLVQALSPTLPPAAAGSAARGPAAPETAIGHSTAVTAPRRPPLAQAVAAAHPHLEQHLSRGLKHCCQAGAAAPHAAGPRAASLRPVNNEAARVRPDERPGSERQRQRTCPQQPPAPAQLPRPDGGAGAAHASRSGLLCRVQAPKSAELETAGEPCCIAPSASHHRCRSGNQSKSTALEVAERVHHILGHWVGWPALPSRAVHLLGGPRAARDEWRAAPRRAGTCAVCCATCCVLRAVYLCIGPGRAGRPQPAVQHVRPAGTQEQQRTCSRRQPHLIAIQALGFVHGQRGADLQAAGTAPPQHGSHNTCVALLDRCTRLPAAKQTLACYMCQSPAMP